MWAKRKNAGFTIVELLIVIVVIGILAAIVIVAFNGINTRAQQTSIASELRQWDKLFALYKAQYGDYPIPAASPTTDGGPGASILNMYCLGTGFPDVSGTRYCYAPGNPAYRAAESRGATLMTELAKVGAPPRDSTKYSYGGVGGPVMRWYSSTDVRLYAVFANGTDCVAMGFITGYTDNNLRQECYIQLR